MGLSILLCLAVQGVANARTDTTAPPTKPAQTSVAPAQKSKHRASARSTKKHAPTRTAAHTSAKRSSKNSRGKKGSKKRGQQVIDSTRAREIQAALIREHYLDGEPSGAWDAPTQAAMQRYQTDQGWQSKTIPDSRALIKLGLGPNNDHLLNPESAMTTSTADPPKLADPKAAAKPVPTEDNIPKQ